MKELKKCPFCGCAAKELQMNDNGDMLHAICCTNTMCIGFDIQPHYYTAADAREAWNRRAEKCA